MKARLRSAGITAGVGVLAAGALLSGSPAHADTPDTITVTWQVNAADFAHRFDVPQTYPALSCGLHQVDVYRYGTAEQRSIVDALLAKGTLSSASEDGAVWTSNTDEDFGPCVTPTPTPTETAPVTPPVTSSPTPSPTGEPTPTSTPVATPSSTATPVPTKSATSRPSASGTATASALTLQKTGTDPSADELAFTGPRDMTRPAVIAILAVISGVALTVRAFVLRRRARKTGGKA